MFYILNRSRNSFYLKDNLDRITHLYFSKDSYQSTLMTNPDVLIMDCTYKTNRYKLPLISTMGTTALNTSFYVEFAFLRQERKENYVWFLQQLKTLYRMLNISYPKVVVTDRDIGLMAAIYSVFPDTRHLLCLWHIHRNVQEHWKPVFRHSAHSDDDWMAFESMWHAVVYSKTEEEYEVNWDALNDAYSHDHSAEVQYLVDTWLAPYKRKFVKAFVDKVLHFDNIATPRVEGGHAVLKHQLGFSTGDLKTVVDNIDLLLKNQHQEYVIKLDEAEMRFPTRLRRPLYSDVRAYITPFALLKVHSQYERLLDQTTPLSLCTGAFRATMGLPCAHEIQES